MTLLGTSESAVVGKPVRALFKSEEEFGQVCRDFQTHRDALGNGYAECELVRAGGSVVACTLQARLLDPLDAKKGGTVVVTDISEKKKMRDAVKESEANYPGDDAERPEHHHPDGHAGRHHVHQYLRGGILRLFRKRPCREERCRDDRAGEEPGGHDLSMMANDLGFNAEGYAINVSENIRRNGDVVWIAWINKAIRDPQGHITEVLCIGHDITDRKRTGEVRISTDTWKDQVVSDTDVREEVFDAVFHISTEISIEGREGKAVGTTFLIGDTKNVLAKSRADHAQCVRGACPRDAHGHKPRPQGKYQGVRPAPTGPL